MTTYQDRFDKADEALRKAQEGVDRSHAIWTDACERLNRIARERLAAWGDLVEASAAESRKQPKDLGERSREELAAMFGQMYAGWDRGVNKEGPDTKFRETPMTAMELEARYVAAEIGVNIYEIANSSAFAPIVVYQTIQKFLGPVFADLERRAAERAQGDVG